MHRTFHKPLIALVGAGLVALMPQAASAQAARAPAAPAQAVQTISAADKAEGAKAHPQLLEEFGGGYTGPQTSYIEGVGKAIALQSGLGNAKSDFTVTVLNSPVNNAFAIPGGYVYVTRELVGLMNNEAELAGVLGHEVGHVAAQHGKKRQSAAQKNAILGVVGTILSGVLLGNGTAGKLGQQIFSQGSQMLTLKYSRSQETEADNLGIAYLNKAGYDPRAMSTVLQSLASQNALEAKLQGSSTRVPEWASTHPADGPRIKAALAKAGAAPKGITNRDKFLAGIDGIMWGDDPKQGTVEGRKFTHPEMRFAFEAPQGFYMVNGTRAVAISGQSAKGELAGGTFTGDLDKYVGDVFAGLTKNGQPAIQPSAVQRTTVNGISAAYAAGRSTTESGSVDLVVFAYQLSDKLAVHFLTVAQAGGAQVFDPMFGSMRRITATEAAAIKARKVVVFAVKKGDTVQSLAAKMAYTDMQLERFLVLNGLTAASALAPGQKLKLITY